MKKQWIALLTGCVLVCSMLAGCGSKPQTSAPAAAGSDKGCTDEAILSQLKNDGTPEFVLDGTYYTLPLEYKPAGVWKRKNMMQQRFLCNPASVFMGNFPKTIRK